MDSIPSDLIGFETERPNTRTVLYRRVSTKVSESTGYGPNSQMSLFGYIVALLIVLVLLPVLPVFVLGWLVCRAFFAEEEEHRFEQWRRSREPREPPSGS